jgi:hypothetical protein
MDKKLLSCPHCDGFVTAFMDNYGKYAIHCAACNMYFGVELECGVELEDGWLATYPDTDALIVAWNQRAPAVEWAPNRRRSPIEILSKFFNCI